MPEPNAMRTIEDALEAANRIVTLVNPLAGVVGSLAELAIKTAHKVGVDPAAFEAEYANYSAKVAGLNQAVADYDAARAKAVAEQEAAWKNDAQQSGPSPSTGATSTGGSSKS